MPSCSISRLTKSKLVSRYCTQYWPQGDLVAGELAVAGSLAASGDDAVEMPPAAVVQFQRQAGRLAQQPVAQVP
ncbi:hypothetical protein RLJV_23885 [Pseudomonas aeruginosa]|nr:hypothetical protein RLJV_23885 [Pseudomonas aeruginosa]